MRRLRSTYRRRTVLASILFLIIGIALGVFGDRWLQRNDINLFGNSLSRSTPAEPVVNAEPTPEATEAPVVTESPTEVPTEVPTEAPTAVPTPEAEQEAAVEVEGGSEAASTEAEAVTEATAAPETEATAAPAAGTEATEAPAAEAEATEAEVTAEAAASEAEAPAAPAEGDAAAESAGEAAEAEAPTETPEPTATPEPTPTPLPDGVIAIVPYGEEYTYQTQIRADGSARLDADSAPYETVTFTQKVVDYMKPEDFAEKYATQYKLRGTEAGVGFDLTLVDYEGQATIVPQNVINVALETESGDIELGYQLMDAEMGGNYGIAVESNKAKTLYKRFQYSNEGEPMAYLSVTTYNDGQPGRVLFKLESDIVDDPTPSVIYPTLQKGVRSDDVKALQQRLIELGYLANGADGIFGAGTEKAVIAAQKAYGLEENGIADNALQQKLFEGVATESSEEAAEGEGD